MSLARYARTAAVALAALMLVTPVTASAAEPTATNTTETASPAAFSASGMHGAGFQNVVALDPRSNGVVLTGADVSGIHRSTDWGRTFTTANTGVSDDDQLHVASIAFSSSDPDKVYAAVGHRGDGGGLLVSTDNGVSWSLRSDVPQFSGSNNTAAGLPTTHPRSTGDLLALDEARGILYAATFEDGVMRSRDDGRTWETLGLAGTYLRTLTLDPENPDLLYAGTYGGGVMRTLDAAGTGAFTSLPGSPSTAEELTVLDGVLYLAAGRDGVFKSADRGASWERLGAAVVRSDGPSWVSINATRSIDGSHLLVVGADKPTRANSSRFDSLVRSTDGGASWSSLTATSSIHDAVGGAGGESWWMLANSPAMGLGKGTYTAAHLAVDARDPGRILVAGRSGVWATSDTGRNWYPMVRGLQVTINKQVAADPRTPGRLYVASTDWTLLYSSDGGRTVKQSRPSTQSVGLSLALDPGTSPSTVYAGVGDRDANSDGEVYVNPDPATSSWTSLGLATVTGGKRPLALASQRANGAPVLLAAVEGGGIWRHAGGKWTQVSTDALNGTVTGLASKSASLSWPTASQAYLHDPTSGVWSSRDGGRTWSLVWAKRSSGAQSTTSIVVDADAPGVVYVSLAGDGLYKITSAFATSTAKVSRLTGVGMPGPVGLRPDHALVVTEVAGTGTPAMKVSRDGGSSWNVVSDASYRATALFPLALAFGPGGESYLALNGNGVLRG